MAMRFDGLRFHTMGDWAEGDVGIAWIDSSHSLPPDADQQVAQAWRDAKGRLGDHLFDGPMCRMERWDSSPSRLTIFLSQTSYKQFLGTNLRHPQWADDLGPKALANPVGVSCLLLSDDGWMLMGRRNGLVAYYPHRTHPFAGALEPRENLNVFDEVRRELNEELNLSAAELHDIRCTGIAEDESIRQPELIFRVNSTLSRHQIESRLDRTEHDDIWAARAERESVDQILASPPADFTPIALAAAACWGRVAFGQDFLAQL